MGVAGRGSSRGKGGVRRRVHGRPTKAQLAGAPRRARPHRVQTTESVAVRGAGGTGKPQQVLSGGGTGSILSFRKTPLGQKTLRVGAGDQGLQWDLARRNGLLRAPGSNYPSLGPSPPGTPCPQPPGISPTSPAWGQP